MPAGMITVLRLLFLLLLIFFIVLTASLFGTVSSQHRKNDSLLWNGLLQIGFNDTVVYEEPRKINLYLAFFLILANQWSKTRKSLH